MHLGLQHLIRGLTTPHKLRSMEWLSALVSIAVVATLGCIAVASFLLEHHRIYVKYTWHGGLCFRLKREAAEAHVRGVALALPRWLGGSGQRGLCIDVQSIEICWNSSNSAYHGMESSGRRLNNGDSGKAQLDKVRRLLCEPHRALGLPRRMGIPALHVAQFRVSSASSETTLGSCIAGLHFCVESGAQGSGPVIVAQFANASLSLTSGLGPLGASCTIDVKQHANASQQSLCQLQLRAGVGRESDIGLHAVAGLQAAVRVQIGNSAAQGALREDSWKRHCIFKSVITLASDSSASWGHGSASNHGEKGSLPLQQVRGSLDAQLTVAPSQRAAVHVSFKSAQLGFDRGAGESSVRVTTPQGVCITTSSGTAPQSAAGLHPSANELNLSDLDASICVCVAPSSAAAAEGGLQIVQCKSTVRVGSIDLKTSLSSARDVGAFGTWLHDMKVLRRIVGQGMESTSDSSSTGRTEKRTVLPPWLEMSAVIEWEQLQLLSTINHTHCPQRALVRVESAGGSVKLCTGQDEQASRHHSSSSSSAHSPDETNAALQDVLSVHEFAVFKSRNISDLLQLRCTAVSKHLMVTTSTTANDSEAAVEEDSEVVCATNLKAQLNITAFMPAMKQYAGFQRVASWIVQDGFLQPASSLGAKKHTTVSNAAPTCLIFGGRLRIGKLNVRLCPTLLAGLKQLSPVFAQFSTAGWDSQQTPASAWFNKMARSMRSKLGVHIDSVVVSAADAGELRIESLTLNNEPGQHETAFFVKASASSLQVYDKEMGIAVSAAPSGSWSLQHASTQSTPSEAWLPHADESIDEYLQRTVLGSVRSHVKVIMEGSSLHSGLHATTCFLHLERGWVQRASTWLRSFMATSAENLKHLHPAPNQTADSSAMTPVKMDVVATHLNVEAGCSDGAAAGIGLQLFRGGAQQASPCLLAKGAQLRWASHEQHIGQEVPMAQIALKSAALFVLQRPGHSSPDSHDPGATSLPQSSMAPIFHSLLQMFGLSASDHAVPVRHGVSAVAARHTWPDLLHDVLPVAFTDHAEVSFTAPPKRHLVVQTSSLKAVYSNFGLSCYKQWVLAAMDVYKATQPVQKLQMGQPASHPTRESISGQPSQFSWASDLKSVQMLLYAARDAPDNAVRGGYMSQAVGSIRIQTPALRVGSLLATEPDGLRPSSTGREQYSSQASGCSVGSAAFRSVVDSVSADCHAFTTEHTSAGTTPHSGTIDWNDSIANEGGVLLSPAPAGRSHHTVPLPYARAKAVSREHAVHFSAAEIQARFIAPGSAISRISPGLQSTSAARSGGETMQLAVFPWAGEAASSGSGEEPSIHSIGGSTERLITDKAVLYVGVGLKSLSLIDNFKLLHGQGDLAASTRVTVDISSAHISANIDEIAEIAHALRVSLAQQSLRQPQQAPIGFSRNIAVYVNGTTMKIVDGQSRPQELCVDVTEVDVVSRFNSTVGAVKPVDLLGAEAERQSSTWKHSLSVSLGWLHAILGTTDVEGLAKTGYAAAGVSSELGVGEVLLGGCLLEEGGAPPTTMAKGSMVTQGDSHTESTMIREATLHIFPDSSAALVVNLTPQRVQFVQAVLGGALGSTQDASPGAAQQELLGPAAPHTPAKQLTGSPRQMQSFFAVQSVHIARATAVVSAAGFLRKPLRHLQVDLPPLRLHDLEGQTVSSLAAQLSGFYAGQVWDYVPKVLKKSVLPNLRASFTPKKVAQKREMRNQRYTPWRPSVDHMPDVDTEMVSTRLQPRGREQDSIAAGSESPGAARGHHRQQSKEATFALLGI